jgi:hypothetical protein
MLPWPITILLARILEKQKRLQISQVFWYRRNPEVTVKAASGESVNGESVSGESVSGESVSGER